LSVWCLWTVNPGNCSSNSVVSTCLQKSRNFINVGVASTHLTITYYTLITILTRFIFWAACLPRPTMMDNYYLYKIYGTYFCVWLLNFLEAYTQRLQRVICAYFYPKVRRSTWQNELYKLSTWVVHIRQCNTQVGTAGEERAVSKSEMSPVTYLVCYWTRPSLWLRRLCTSFPTRPVLNPRSVNVGFVANEVVLGPGISISTANYHSTDCSILIYHLMLLQRTH
jgi:hypothetical protein